MKDETTQVVIQADEMRDGEMRQVKVGETDVLVVRADGEFYAVGAHCPHNGVELVQGVLHGTRLVCPWHHACFDVTTGQTHEPPALNNLALYPVRKENGAMVVTVNRGAPGQPPAPIPYDLDPVGLRLPKFAAHKGDSRTFVVIGGGAAGHVALETLREEGYAGRLVLVTNDPDLPYDRTMLSKDFLTGKATREWLPLRHADFYQKYAIEVLRGDVTGVDSGTHTITLADSSTVQYDALLLATGSTPRTLDVSGADLPHVFTLRRIGDVERILAAIKPETRVVVIGSSFIGMEGAAGLTQRKAKVTVVGQGRVPFKAILGERVGRMFQAVHEEKGVEFRNAQKVARIAGQDKVESVVLASDEHLPADVVLIGVGVQPATGFLGDSGLKIRDDGGVVVNEYLEAVPDVWAAGDIAVFPERVSGQTTRIEHWRVAEQHGRTAALNMLGQRKVFDDIPYFWSGQFGQALRYVGHCQEWDDIVYWGDPDARSFVAFYIKDGHVRAAAGSKRDKDIAAIEEIMRTGQPIAAAALANDTLDLVALMREFS